MLKIGNFRINSSWLLNVSSLFILFNSNLTMNILMADRLVLQKEWHTSLKDLSQVGKEGP